MAEELLSFGIQKLWNLLSQEYAQFKGVEDQVTELKTDLNRLKSFLKDADAKKHKNTTVRNCVEEIKEIIYDAEDILETFILRDQLRKTSSIKKRIRRFAYSFADRRKFASGLRGISKRISKVIINMQSFGVVQQIVLDGSEYSLPLQESLRGMREEFAGECEADLVGLEPNVDKLVGYLMEEDNVQVVSVIGMGGLTIFRCEEWIVEEGSMNLLHTLTIFRCEKLKELPDGLRFITSLKHLEFFSEGEKWKERLSERGEDYYKVQHIPSVKTQVLKERRS